MSVPHLPEVSEKLPSLHDEILSASAGASSLWQIDGPPTAGKSTLLRSLSGSLAAAGKCAVLVSPPQRARDSGAVALIEIAGSLKEAGKVNGQLCQLKDPKVAWEKKLGLVRDAIEGDRDEIVLLCDEPDVWGTKADKERHFGERSRSVVSLLLDQVTCRRVFAGRLSESRPATQLSLRARSEPRSWLENGDAWGLLCEGARGLAASSQRNELDNLSPLSVRLLVGLVTLRGAEVSAKATASGRRELSEEFIRAISEDAELSSLRRVWGALALVRQPFDDAVLRLAGAEELSSLAKDLLKSCLLYRQDDTWVMHEMLRIDAYYQKWLSKEEKASCHGRFATHYVDRFSGARLREDTSEALREQMEAYHHATESQNGDLVAGVTPFFVDQLNLWGRALSYGMKDYATAATVFGQAVVWDSNDDYAHHYLAYNLDIQGTERAQVKEHYEAAIEIDPANAWWRSRYVNFLITLGRVTEAKRAWADALDALGLPDPDEGAFVYQNLHVWVARMLLHRGQVDFAKVILEGIPPDVMEMEPGLAAMRDRVDALIEAQERRAIFPLYLAPASWWAGPHVSSRKGLAKWLPGRVESVDEDGVHICVAEKPPAGDPPTYGMLTLSTDDFTRYSQDEDAGRIGAGAFLEIAYYEGSEQPVIRIHPSSSWRDHALPPLFPDPARYLRRSGQVR